MILEHQFWVQPDRLVPLQVGNMRALVFGICNPETSADCDITGFGLLN